MKGTTFLIVLLISGLVLAFGRVGTAFDSDAAGSLSRTQTLENPTSQPRQLMADRTDTNDRIIYGTDPEMDRAMDEQQREEKEKEEKAWQMLQHMNIYQDNGRRPHSARPDNAPPQ